MGRAGRFLLFFLMFSLPLASFSQEKRKAVPKKKPAAGRQAKKKQQDDWGRFNSTSKRDLDAADKKKAEKAAKK
jgi:hypothetical protein